MLRPIRYEYLVDMDARLRIVLAIGNPLVWWSSTLAVLAGLVALARRAITRTFSPDDPLVPIILGYVVMLLPWIPGTRIPYIYNYLPIYAFALLYLPLATTLPIEEEDLRRLILFDSWFYQESTVPGSGCTPPDPAPRCF